jgi:acetolactate synthase-1/2/3 large subunit
MVSKRKYACLIADWLKDLGYTHCFFLPGGGCMHLLDCFRTAFVCIPVVHEVSAGIAAEHFNEGSTGNKAFALVTTGPGLTNIVTAAASCFTEHRELLIIAGQVKSTDLAPQGVRQLGVQEINGKELFKSITVSSHSLDKCIGESKFKEIVRSAELPHPGPVLIEVCLDIQGALVDPTEIESSLTDEAVATLGVNRDKSILSPLMDKAIGMLRSSSRPVLMIGGLVNRVTAWQMLDRLEELGIPVVTTTSAIDRVPSDLNVYAGRPSTWGGQRSANLILAQSDLIFAFGAQLDLQQTGFNVNKYAPNAQIIQVFPSEAELSKPGPPNRTGINTDVNKAFVDVLSRIDMPKPTEWLEYVQTIRKKYPSLEPENITTRNGMNPFEFLSRLSLATSKDDVLALSSSGIAFTAALQMYELKRRQIASVSCAFASMGYGLATAIGLAFANRDKRVLLVEGDGSFSQNLQELAIVSRHRLNVRIFILDNGGYASIRATQKKFFNGDYVGCDETTGLGFPDWENLFRAYGIPCETIVRDDLDTNEIGQLLNRHDGPHGFVVKVDPDGRSWPLVRTVLSSDGKLSSAPLFDMAPRIPEEERKVFGKYLHPDLWD